MAGTTYGIPNGLTYAQFVAFMVSVGYSATDPNLPTYYANYLAGGGGVVTPEPTPTPPPPTPPPTTPGATFMSWIITSLQGIGNWFWSIHQTVEGWVWPFYLVADFFWQLSLLFYNLASYFTSFSDWVSDVASRVGNYLSWDTIWSYILSYVPNLISLRDWFYSWWSNVTSVITSWWSATSATVHGWITAAIQGLGDIGAGWLNFWNNLWPQLVSGFNSLKSAWDNFWLVTFPNLVSFAWLATWWNSRLLDVQGLLNSTLKTWFPFYDDLVELWSDIALFFTNPLQYLWERFTDWFFGGS